MEICLSCTKLDCKSGVCDKVKQKTRVINKPTPPHIIERRAKVKELYEQGFNGREIGEKLGFTTGAIAGDILRLREQGVIV